MDEINKKLKQINIEDYIWLIYIGIIFLSWHSNELERKYYIYNDEISKNKYQKEMIIIFLILTLVYFYFFLTSLDDFKNIKKYNKNKQKLIILSFLGALFVLISGIIFLYIAVTDNKLDVEIAFN